MDADQMIYRLKLHGSCLLPDGDHVRRVPGGWIYSMAYQQGAAADPVMRPVFVPFDNEFQEVQP